MLRMLRAVVVCVLLSAVARAATINVGPSGSGAAYTSIQAAINVAQPGDTVLVAPGTYYENIDFKGNAITVTSSGGAASTIIDGGSAGPAASLKTGEPRTAVLSGFTLLNGTNSSNPGTVLVSDSTPTILNNVIRGGACGDMEVEFAAPLIQGNNISGTLTTGYGCGVDGGAGIALRGDYQSYTPGNQALVPLIIGNTIENNIEGDSGGAGGGAIAIWAANPLIENNILRNNVSPESSGAAVNSANSSLTVIAQNLIYGNSAGCGGGALALEAGGIGPGENALIINNTIVNNTVYTGGGGSSACSNIAQIYPSPYSYGDSGPTQLFVNNIISGSTSDPAVNCNLYDPPSEADQPLFDHNILYNAGGAFFGSYCIDTSGRYGNVVADPKFVDAANDNFQLSDSSPAIDAGNTSVLQTFLQLTGTALTSDFAGNPRLEDFTDKGYPIIDMGAYEHAGVTTASATTVILTPSEYGGAAGGTNKLMATLASPLGVPTGNVTFFLDDQSVGSAAIASNGIATLNNIVFVPGVHHLLAQYGGQGSFSPAISVIVIIDISKYSTSLTLQNVPNPSIVGQSVTFTVTSSSADTAYIPSPITLTDTSTNTTLQTLTPDPSSGIASFSTSSLTLGYHNITAMYAGDATHTSSSAYGGQNVLSGYPVNMTLKSSQNPSIVNQSVTFTAQVTTSVTGQGTPAGSIVFTYGSTVLGTELMDGTGTASVSTSSLPLGYDTITATYQPSNTFAANSTTLSQQVISGYPTSTTLTSSLNPAKPGQTVVFTANVSSANGTPTGSIAFSDGPIVVSTVVLASGVTSATWSSSTLAIGTHDITAQFMPTGNFVTSVGEVIETIGYSTVTTTSDAPEPSTYGQPVVFSVHVAGVAAPGTPTGIVVLEFCHGATIQLTLDANGNASVVTPTGNEISEPVGSCAYTANYQGDATFLASVSASTPYVVTPANSTTTVGASPNPGYVGQAVTLTAQVVGVPSPTLGPGGTILPPGAVVATGTVQFYDGVTPIGGAVTINAAGQASLTTNALVLGANTITAKYSGDANLNGSASAGVVETIVQVGTTTALSVTPNPGTQNEPVTMSVNVAALAGAMAPYGAVAIYDGTNLLTTLTVPGGSGTVATVSFTTSTLAVGTHMLKAVYTPTCIAAGICTITGFTGSQSSVVTLVILPQDFTLSTNPPSITIETEHHGLMTLGLASIGGFAAPITLSCAGTIPEWVTCEFSPQQVMLPAGGTNVPATLTIDTDALLDYKSDAGLGGRVILAGLLPVMLIGFRRRRGLRGLVVMAIASVIVMAMTACSGQYPPHTTPGTYTVTVQASGQTAGASAPTVHTLDVTLVVTP